MYAFGAHQEPCESGFVALAFPGESPRGFLASLRMTFFTHDMGTQAGTEEVAPSISSISSIDGTLIVVAKGQQDLLRDLRAVFGGIGRTRIIEDRRRDRTLLPRERLVLGRQASCTRGVALRASGSRVDDRVAGPRGNDISAGLAVSARSARGAAA